MNILLTLSILSLLLVPFLSWEGILIIWSLFYLITSFIGRFPDSLNSKGTNAEKQFKKDKESWEVTKKKFGITEKEPLAI